MKFSIIASLAFAALSWASPVDSAETVGSVVASLKARTPDAAFFHAGADHVLRAISEDFQVIGTAGLTKKQVDQFHGTLGESAVKRDVVDERDIVSSVEQSVRRDNEGAELFERQSCPTFCPLRGKCSDICNKDCYCTGGSFSVCRCA
ncbi:hypothetical protein CC79DRAFT_1316763 [Sarocladium strictum]